MQNSRITYCGIEEASTNPKEHPGIDCQREAKGQGYIQQLRCVWDLSRCRCRCRPRLIRICYLRAGESEEEEEKGTSKFSAHGDEVVPDPVREEVEDGNPV